MNTLFAKPLTTTLALAALFTIPAGTVSAETIKTQDVHSLEVYYDLLINADLESLVEDARYKEIVQDLQHNNLLGAEGVFDHNRTDVSQIWSATARVWMGGSTTAASQRFSKVVFPASLAT